MIPANSAPKVMSLVRPRVSEWRLCDPAEAPPGLGAVQPMFYRGQWYARERGTGHPMKYGVGQTASPTLIDAANTLVSFLNSNGCTQSSQPVVSAFQSQYNASGFPGSLTVDGQYGGNTQRALDNVLTNAWNQSGNSGPAPVAPGNCFGGTQYGTEVVTPAPDVIPAGTAPSTPNTPTQQQGTTVSVTGGTGQPMNMTSMLLIGGAVVLGAGLLAYTVMQGGGRRRARA